MRVFAAASLIFLVCACEGPPPEVNGTQPPASMPAVRTVDGITYRAEVRTAGLFRNKVRATVSLTNTSGQPVKISYGDCKIGIRAYPSPDRSLPPAWEWRQGQTGACWLVLWMRTLAPGQFVTFVVTAPTRINPFRRYHYVVSFRIIEPSAECIELAA
jgi:hypothetical protein